MNAVRSLLTRAGFASVLVAVLLLGVGLGGPREQQPDQAKPQAEAKTPKDCLTSRPSGGAPADPVVKEGDQIKTTAGERRRVAFRKTRFFINQNTQVKFSGANRVELAAGEIYVEVPRMDDFAIATPRGEVSGKLGHWAIRADNKGTGVAVTRGLAFFEANGKRIDVPPGHQLMPGSTTPEPLPRASHLLDWTKDLMASASSPLVPGSEFAGGTIVAKDPDGQEAKITLRKFHVDVHIEDGFARTTIDQTYFNHENWQLEGTFYFPLPPDASLSRLAMYVDGRLMEGGMVERDYGRQVYDTIRYANRDPALLEWMDGSTFKMRVFPLAPRTERRIILSYTQRLPSLYGRTEYRFPAGHSLQQVDQWSFRARVKEGADVTWTSPSHAGAVPGALKARKDGKDLVLEGSAKNARTDRDVIVQLTDKAAAQKDAVRFSSVGHEGYEYLMLRLRPSLQIDNPKSEIKNRLWLFLFESSGDRDPLLGRTQIEVIRNLLLHAQPSDKFMVATANTRVRWHAPEPQAVTAANIQSAISFLEKAHLIGALDLANALLEARRVSEGHANAYIVHVGSGVPAMGERRDDALVARIAGSSDKSVRSERETQARYVGVGVGRRWNRAFMKAAAEKTGGHFTQINPDEPIAWRSFDLAATLNTPRLMNVQVTAVDGRTEIDVKDGKPVIGPPRFLAFNHTIAQGEEICALTRVGPVTRDPKAAHLPKSVRITGTLDGKPVEHVLKVEKIAQPADYLPRTWAKLEIDRLLADGAAKNKDAIIALSKAMYVMTPFTSLIVLEHDDLYVQYKVDRGRKDHWAMYDCPAKIPVVYEPEAGQADPRKTGKKLPGWIVVKTTVAVRDTAGLVAKPAEAQPGGANNPTHAMPDSMIAGAPAPDRLDNLVGRWGTLSPRGQARVLKELGRDSAEPSVHFPTTGTELFARPARERGGEVRFAAPRPLERREQRKKLEDEAEELSSRNEFGLPVLSKDPAVERLFKYYGRAVSKDQSPVADVTDRYGWRGLPVTANGLLEDPSSRELLYTRPSPTNDARIFYDLLAYAPGMNTSRADIEAVVEAEALPLRSSRPGQIDAAARELIDKARVKGWHTLTIPAEGGQPGFDITFDGTGRYVYDRVLPLGIKERVVCDGKTLTHLYPQLFIGAKRDVSRFHRADFAAVVPWAMQSAEDLAHGADLKAIGDRTVAIVPHYEAKLREINKKLKEGRRSKAEGREKTEDPSPKTEDQIEWMRVHLVFGDDGRLSERQVVRMPKGEVVYRQIIEREGTIRLVDAKNKELAVRKGKLARAENPPDLSTKTKDLVVLHLPYRTASHVQQTLKIEKKQLQDLRFAEALPLFASYIGAGSGSDALTVFQRCFFNRDQRSLGFYVLLASAGVNLDAQNADVLAEHLDEPLAQYLALHSSPVLRKHASQWAVASTSWKEPFLQHLATTHALFQRWQSDKIVKAEPAKVKADRDKAFDYVKKHADSGFGWAMLCLLEDRATDMSAFRQRVAKSPRDDKDFHRELAGLFALYKDHPSLGYAAKYEAARSLFRAGDLVESRKRFGDLYAQTLKDDVLPAIDADFRQALLGKNKEADLWSEQTRKTTKDLIAQKKRPAVLALAWQCWQLDDEPLANALFAAALDGIKDAKERNAMNLAGLEFLWQTKQVEQADDLLKKLTADKDLAKRAGLWRLGVKFADHREMSDRALECLEKALELEFAKQPEVIDLRTVRSEYGRLLGHYDRLAEAMVTLKVKPPADFIAKVVRAADRWRALDRDAAEPCTQAATILQRFGERELGWDYLTTPVALKPAESQPWLGIAHTLSRRGELDLTDRAYKAAYEAEPTNAQILWDRAMNLRRLGRAVQARTLFRQIAEGTWQPRFQGLRNQARGQMDGT